MYISLNQFTANATLQQVVQDRNGLIFIGFFKAQYVQFFNPISSYSPTNLIPVCVNSIFRCLYKAPVVILNVFLLIPKKE